MKLSILLLVLLSVSLQARNLPNVIIIFSDDHGYTDLGIHGIDDQVSTPHMDALAKGGAWMKAGYSTAPQCRPSRCGLMAGRIQNEFALRTTSATRVPGQEPCRESILRVRTWRVSRYSPLPSG